MTLKFDYVASALGFGIVPSKFFAVDQRKYIKDALLGLTATLQLNLIEKCKYISPSFSGLFNAWTEEDLVDVLKYLENMSLRSIYSDSGGLQIVTAGKSITEDLKRKVYEVQTYSDYAMCFDDIPLESDAGERNRNERSNLFNKVFMRDKHATMGRSTAENIKQQINVFRDAGAKTKVFLIAHGNNAEDMLAYYRCAADILTEDDYKYVGGLAFSKMCIGTGALENIEMMKGARLISNESHPNVHRHLHILGAGSLDRLRPALYLFRSGYLGKFSKFSTDSSSHTSCFDYGLLKTDGGCVSLGDSRTREAEAHFLGLYRMFENAVRSWVTEDQFLQCVFGDGKYYDNGSKWSYSKIRDRAMTSEDDGQSIIIAHIIKTLHTYFQIDNFVVNIDKIWGEGSGNAEKSPTVGYLEQLSKVSDDKDMDEWSNHFARHTESKRIRTVRRSNLSQFIKLVGGDYEGDLETIAKLLND